jgi:uridylate kinase
VKNERQFEREKACAILEASADLLAASELSNQFFGMFATMMNAEARNQSLATTTLTATLISGSILKGTAKWLSEHTGEPLPEAFEIVVEMMRNPPASIEFTRDTEKGSG